MVLKVANEHKLEEYHRVYAFVPFAAIVLGGERAQILQIKGFFEASVKIAFGDALRQTEAHE
jgi:hypothetical protein